MHEDGWNDCGSGSHAWLVTLWAAALAIAVPMAFTRREVAYA